MTARFVRGLLARVFPAYGRHRVRRVPEAAPAPEPRRTRHAHRPLPPHRSPYARDAAEAVPFLDEPSPVRPYMAHWTGAGAWPDGSERRAQAERRWVLDMALRGFDAGPAVIHGVYVRPGDGPRVPRSVVA
ncbi:hypothetical protein [Streptomyces sp. NPDC093589]|uniref:hypothetical protein n=1 Tax=Streptomyces sp. NPDC093589 TaxID=3366043 RepID=UPI003820F9A9